MKVEILYFEGCPGYAPLLARLEKLLAEHAPGATIALRAVESAGAAEKERFLGSPSVRIDGRDVEPAADARHDFGLKCRLYATPEGRLREPPDEWIREALRR
jgi:hypothetical protein